MKKSIATLLILLASCSKPQDLIIPEEKGILTATALLKTTDKTLYYDVFVNNDAKAPANLWIWAGRIEKHQVKNGIASFKFDPQVVCGYAISTDKKVYGASRETITGNISLSLDYNSVTINK